MSVSSSICPGDSGKVSSPEGNAKGPLRCAQVEASTRNGDRSPALHMARRCEPRGCRQLRREGPALQALLWMEEPPLAQPGAAASSPCRMHTARIGRPARTQQLQHTGERGRSMRMYRYRGPQRGGGGGSTLHVVARHEPAGVRQSASARRSSMSSSSDHRPNRLSAEV